MGVAGMLWCVYQVNTVRPLEYFNAAEQTRLRSADQDGAGVKAGDGSDGDAFAVPFNPSIVAHTLMTELGRITACAHDSEVRRREKGSGGCFCGHLNVH